MLRDCQTFIKKTLGDFFREFFIFLVVGIPAFARIVIFLPIVFHTLGENNYFSTSPSTTPSSFAEAPDDESVLFGVPSVPGWE